MMKKNQFKVDIPTPTWRKVTAFINVFLLIFYTCLPGTVAAYELISNAFIETEVNSSPQFQPSANSAQLFEKAYYVEDSTSQNSTTIADFHKTLLSNRKASLPNPLMIPIINGDITIIIPHYPLAKQIGDDFVQARFIRSQIFNLVNRSLLSNSYNNEAAQINDLYNNAFDFSGQSSKLFGDTLSQEDVNTFGRNFIWPELRDVNGQQVLVPIVHLTNVTIDALLVDSHIVEFNGGTVELNSITINSGKILAKRNAFINLAGDLTINEGSALVAEQALNLKIGGTLQNISGQLQAQDNVNIIAGQYLQKTVVHRFATPTSQGTRLGEIASVNSITGDVSIKAMGDLVVKGGNIEGNNIVLQANSNIILQSQETTYTSSGVVNGWDESESSITQLQSQLTAKESISLMAAGAIEINASTLHADKGVIDILAGQGVYILNANNQFQSARSGKFGSNTIQEQEFQSIAVRSALNAGQGIVIATEFGDINLTATELTSTTGTEIRANNGAVNFLMTKEQETYFYNKVHEGFWKIKTTTIEDNVETAVYNEIIGGVKVQATHGLTIQLAQYENGSTQENGQDTVSARISEDIQALKAQIASAKASGQSIDSLNAQLATLSDQLLQEQLSELAGVNSSLEWMQTLHNDPEYQDNFNIAYQELIEIHKFDKTSTLSPAAMAIIAIAVAVASGGAGLVGVGGAITGTAGGFISAGVMQAGFLAIATQAATGLASGQGLEDTAKSLFHSDNIKATATAMVTAGVMNSLGDSFTLFEDFPKNELGNYVDSTQQLQSIGYQASVAVRDSVVRSGISTVIAGGDLGDFEDAFYQSLAQSAIDSLGRELATEIGLAKDIDTIGTATQYISHAAVGCLTGTLTTKLSGGESELGCYSGAGGAVIGELIGSHYKDELQEDLDLWIKEKLESDAILSRNDITQQAYAFKQRGVDMARLGSALVAFVSGGDVNIAGDSGRNAAENNALFTISVILVTAYTSYVSYQEGGIYQGLQAIGTGNDPLSIALSEATDSAVMWASNEYPEKTLEVAAVLSAVGEKISEGVRIISTTSAGVEVIRYWNEIPLADRNAIIGGSSVVSFLIPAGVITKLKIVKNTDVELGDWIQNENHENWGDFSEHDKEILLSDYKLPSGASSLNNPLITEGNTLPRNSGLSIHDQLPETNTCGPNACAMVLDSLGVPTDPTRLLDRVSLKEGGINGEDVKLLYSSSGAPATRVTQRSMEKLEEHVNGLSVYSKSSAPVTVRINKAGTTYSHWIVVDGITTRGPDAKRYVAIRDPAGGKEYFSPIETFTEYFSGEFIFINK